MEYNFDFTLTYTFLFYFILLYIYSFTHIHSFKMCHYRCSTDDILTSILMVDITIMMLQGYTMLTANFLTYSYRDYKYTYNISYVINENLTNTLKYNISIVDIRDLPDNLYQKTYLIFANHVASMCLNVLMCLFIAHGFIQVMERFNLTYKYMIYLLISFNYLITVFLNIYFIVVYLTLTQETTQLWLSIDNQFIHIYYYISFIVCIRMFSVIVASSVK